MLYFVYDFLTLNTAINPKQLLIIKKRIIFEEKNKHHELNLSALYVHTKTRYVVVSALKFYILIKLMSAFTQQQKDVEIVKNNNKPGPKSAQSQKHSNRNKRRPPRGMYLIGEDLVSIATGPLGQGDAILKSLDAEIVTLKRQVQFKDLVF